MYYLYPKESLIQDSKQDDNWIIGCNFYLIS